MSLLLFKNDHEFQIINIDFQNVVFDWIDLERILDKWKLSCNQKTPRPKKLRCTPQPSEKMLSRSLNREQFVDACMLAGTEYCLTFPYLQVDQASCHIETLGLGHLETSHFRKFFLRWNFLNLNTKHPTLKWQVARFNFDVAVNVAKQAPSIGEKKPVFERKHFYLRQIRKTQRKILLGLFGYIKTNDSGFEWWSFCCWRFSMLGLWGLFDGWTHFQRFQLRRSRQTTWRAIVFAPGRKFYTDLPIHSSIPFVYAFNYVIFVCLFACLFVCLFVCLLACLLVSLFVCLFACLFVCLFVCLLFLWNLQHFVQSCIHQGFKFDGTSRYNSAKNGHWSSWWHLWNQHEMLRICFRTEYFTGFILSFFFRKAWQMILLMSNIQKTSWDRMRPPL